MDCAWWCIEDGTLGQSGKGDDWRAALIDDPQVIGILPAGAARVEILPAGEVDTPQKQTAARLAVTSRSIGGVERLHSAIGLLPDGRGAVALADKDRMEDWLGWARRQDLDLRHIIPAALLLPVDGEWHRGGLGGEEVFGRDGLAFAADPAMQAALVGDQPVSPMDEAAIEHALLREAGAPTVDLRSGPYAYRRPWRLDPSRLREFAVLAALIALLALLIPLVHALRWEAAADRMDARTEQLASDALGRPVTADEAEHALAAGGGSAIRESDMLAALLGALENEGLVRASAIGWQGDGQLTATLVGPDAPAINRLLAALQRDGWAVTADGQPSNDGRARVVVTMGATR